MNFLVYLQGKGIFPPSSLTFEEAVSPEHTPEDQAQAFVDAGICSEEEMSEYLFQYRMENFLDENTVNVTEKNMTSVLLEEYLPIIEDCFSQLYKVKIEYGPFVNLPSISNDLIILQRVVGKGSNSYTSGLAINGRILLKAAEELYGRLDKDLPAFGGTVQDAADLFCEAVNNINGFSTYRFDAGYDLMISEYKENATISAPGMYVSQIEVLDYVIDLFLIIGTDYNISKAVE